MNKSGRFAVVVGINDYSGSDPENLTYCTADAEAFYDALLLYCEYELDHVFLFSDGTHPDAKKPLRSDILSSIHYICDRADDKDSILLFFAGHGTRDKKDSYLLTKEYRAEILEQTSIPMSLINDKFLQSRSRFKMRFFDACHSGRMGRRSTLPAPDIKSHFLVEAEGWATLSACKEDQFAHEDPHLGHGIFSYFLIKGLSGSAATDKQEVTLDSLRTYVFAQTSEVTEQLGLIQTPVFDGVQAGTLVMASASKVIQAEITTALERVRDTDIDQIRPTPSKIPEIVTGIRSIFEDEMEERIYVASSQEVKVAFGERLVQTIFRWCKDQESLYSENLKDLVAITVNCKSISSCPLNFQLAQYINDSKIKSAIEWEFKYRTKSVQGPSWFPSVFYNTTTEQVMNGIGERSGYYTSAVEIIVSPRKLFPTCTIVIAIIPATFGLYLLRYSCSTSLGLKQMEYWDTSTFSVRTLHAIPIEDKAEASIMEELKDVYAQLISFFSESSKARKIYLRSIGVSGESLI